MSHRIQFQFDLGKLVQSLAFFASSGVQDLTKLKAAKLLFFADKRHLVRYGRPILGDRYVSMDHGPVPSESLDVMNRVIAPDEIADAVREEVARHLSVHRSLFARHPQFRARTSFDPRVFSASEREVLEEIAKEYGSKPVGVLIDLTHREPAWRRSNEGRTPGSSGPMPYETFFEGESAEAQRVLQLARAQQEDRDFVAALTR